MGTVHSFQRKNHDRYGGLLDGFLAYRAMSETIKRALEAVGITTYGDLMAATPAELGAILLDDTHLNQVIAFRDHPMRRPLQVA